MKLLPKNQIFVFDNVLSLELCSELRKIIDKYATTTEKSVVSGSNVNGLTCGLVEIDEELVEKWENIMFKTIGKIINLVKSETFVIPMVHDTGYQLRKIYGPTKLHVDGLVYDKNEKYIELDRIRTASIIIALNSDYEGGEFVFPEQDVRIKLKAGQAIVFPPYWTHPHKTEELNGTYRYTVNTWLSL
jgi:predicted 2-oxoglutarate/Fe(II)-dependent dioxygenase YbiX